MAKIIQDLAPIKHPTIFVLILALAVWLVTPALAQGVAGADLIAKGEKLFKTAGEIGCAACHGLYAEGDLGIGPYNRGVGEEKIRAALNSIEDMAFLKEELGEDGIKQIAAYYAWLGELQLIKTLAKRGRFIPEKASIFPGTRIQLVIKNSSRFARNFASQDMGIAPFKVPGRTAVELIWTAPDAEGEFNLECTDCRLKGQALTLAVSRAAKRHVSPTAKATAVAATGSEPAGTEIAALPVAKISKTALEKGRELFLTVGEVGCVACHGPYAEGDVGIGPYNRGFDEKKIRDALHRVDVMKFLHESLADAQIGQVAAYYAWLGQHQLFKAVAVRGRFFPNKIQVFPGTPIQLAINNRSRAAHMFTAPDMGIKSLDVRSHESGDLFWTAPAKEGSFTLTCTDCNGGKGTLTVEVTKKAKRYRPGAAP